MAGNPNELIDTARRKMLRELYKAMYDEEVPTMPISPAELWQQCLFVIAQTGHDYRPVSWRGWAEEGEEG